MRRSLAKIPTPVIGNAARNTFNASSSFAFSTSAGGDGGAGRGRGRGFETSNYRFTAPGKTSVDDNEYSKDEYPVPSGIGHGRGRGKPMESAPTPPSFSPFTSGRNFNPASSGRGRGSTSTTTPPPPPPQTQHSGTVKKPIFFRKEDSAADTVATQQVSIPPRAQQSTDMRDVRVGILSSLTSTGMGRGKPTEPSAVTEDKPKEVNRHILVQQPAGNRGQTLRGGTTPPPSSSPAPKLSREEALKRALGVLSKGDEVDKTDSLGRGRGAFRGRGRGKARRDTRGGNADDDYGKGLYLGNNADGERLAKRLGPEIMAKLVEGFEEMSDRVLPSLVEDAYADALHTNLLIECEPEFRMEDFGKNPNIDEKPPLSIRETFEKLKPLLIVSEGITSEEEWEEVMKATMENVPVIKEIVDRYGGPDRITAKTQQEELQRIAKTVPECAPASVKRFAECAVTSLQSNPGWGFAKKCQFMNKMVSEVSQHYK